MMRQKLCLIGMTILLSACSDNGFQDLAEWTENVKSQKKASVEPLPTITRYESFVYSSAQRRSPFDKTMSEQKLNIAVESNGIAPDLERRKEALERFPLDSLRMVGTVAKGNTVWALVQAPDITIHKITEGNYLGQHHGKVTAIEDHATRVVEIIPDGTGSWIERDAAISITQDESKP